MGVGGRSHLPSSFGDLIAELAGARTPHPELFCRPDAVRTP